MKRTNIALAVCMLGSALLAGCSDTQGDVGNRNIRPNSVLVDGNGNRVIDKRFADDQFNEMNRVYGRRLNSNNLIGNHQNYRMEISQDIAERLNGIAGIGTSCVILTDRNAYVAVRSSQDEPQGPGASSGGNAAPSRIGTHSTGTLGYPRMFEASDIERDTAPLRNGMGMKSTRTDSRAGLDRQSAAEGRADAGQGSRSKGSAGTGKLARQVADIVHEMAPQIEQVYVSQDPEFYGRMAGYVQEAGSGQPIQGYIAEFNAMVDRLFPLKSGIRVSRGTDAYPFD